MADPHVGQEAGQPPENQGRAPINLSICINRSPDAAESYGTAQGINSRRLLQARQDDSLNIVHRPQPEHPRRPQDLFDILPPQTRKLFTQAVYLLTPKKDRRRYACVVVTTSSKYLPKPNRNMVAFSHHDQRAVFRVGKAEIDVPTLRFLQSTIGNICERRKYQ